jgi:CRISPR/Cas system-associated protein endoribonuclease Cas2
MARRKTSRVARNQSKKKIMMGNLIATLPTKGNIKNSAIETGKDLIIGVVAGGFA